MISQSEPGEIASALNFESIRTIKISHIYQSRDVGKIWTFGEEYFQQMMSLFGYTVDSLDELLKVANEIITEAEKWSPPEG